MTLCAAIPEEVTRGGTQPKGSGAVWQCPRDPGVQGVQAGAPEAAPHHALRLGDCPRFQSRLPGAHLGQRGSHLTRQVTWGSPWPHPDKETHPKLEASPHSSGGWGEGRPQALGSRVQGSEQAWVGDAEGRGDSLTKEHGRCWKNGFGDWSSCWSWWSCGAQGCRGPVGVWV